MNHDAIIRAVCVAAAAALAAGPYWPQIRSAAERAAQSVRERSGSLTRMAAVLLLLAAAFVRVPLPSLSVPVLPINLETPTVEMQQKVADVAKAMANAGPVDRAIWAAVWEKAAIVVAAPEGPEPVFTDTRSLRGFTVLSLDIAWRRLGGNPAGSAPGLREAVERVMTEAVGLDVKPVDSELRKRYAEACRAIAWAGVGRG